MTGIRYITDENGQKTDLIISLKEHSELIEDLLDIILAEERKNEDAISFDDFMAELKAERNLDA